MAHQYNGILFNNTKGMNQGKEARPPKATHSITPFSWHSGKGKTIGKKRDQWFLISGCWVGEAVVYKGMAQGNFGGNGTPLHGTAGVDIPFCAFVKDCHRVS